MSETSILFESHDQIRTLFGPQDQNLRRVREAVGVDIFIRGDELRFAGTPEQIERGHQVIGELLGVIERKRQLTQADLDRALGVAPVDDSGIDLHEPSRAVKPRSAGQSEYIRAIRESDLVFCSGPAGSGKTYLSVAMALNALRSEQVRRIVLVRPAVEAGEKLGFLPGDMLAKVNPFLRPLLDALNDMLDFEQVRRYMDNDVIEIAPLAFMRGRTLNETFMILDEAQNTTITQMKMFLTRMGSDSKIVGTGDDTQIDLEPGVRNGLTDSIERLGGIERVGVVRLTRDDIVRHRLVREIVAAYESQAPMTEVTEDQ